MSEYGYSVQVPGLVVVTSSFTPPGSAESESGSSIGASLEISSSSNEPDAPGQNATALMLVPAQQTPPVFNPFAGGPPGTASSSSDAVSYTHLTLPTNREV